MNKNLCFGIYLCMVWGEVLTNQTELAENLTSEFRLNNTEEQNIKNEITEITEIKVGRNTTLPLYTKWSSWSRCEHCLQKRMRKCINPKCRYSKMYEERLCNRKRCKRKRRTSHPEELRVVHLEADMQKASRERSRVWSKWSKWSKCTKQCRTFRFRKCKKPGRCKKRKQRQAAYCYYDNTRCQNYVLNLLDMKNRRRADNNRYAYGRSVHGGSRQTTIRSTKCGQIRRKSNMLKIIGGTEAKKYKWPWHAAIINKYREVFCAGTLIAPKWILTAGHCIRSFLKVRLNEHDLSAVDGRELELTVQKIFLHPRFNHQIVDNDIALLRLPKAIRLPPVCLPAYQPEPEEMCSIMGWGKINSSDEYGTTILHEAKIPVVNWDSCTKAYRRYILTPNMFCAGWASGIADTCAGDSGGGLMCPARKGAKIRGYSIQGITSFGDGCGRKNKYGIYTMVYNYLDWINYIIETYS